MTNILFMIDSLGYGGTELQLVEMLKSLDRAQFRPHLCMLKGAHRLYDDLDLPKITLGFIGFTHPSIVRNVRELGAFVREHRIEIVQTYFQDPFLLAAMLKPFHRVKLIGAFRDLGFWRTPSETRKMRLAYPFFSGFIANSQAVKEHFVHIDRLSAASVEVIHNGFDLAAVPAGGRGAACPDAPVVGIVANLNRPVKRVQDFVRAAAQVAREMPQARFVIVGDGHLRGELEALAVSLGIRQRLTFTGRIDNPFSVIRSFSVGVISSETEGFCNAIVECLACGVPVVATDAGGNGEIVVDGENGFLVPVGDCGALAQRIIQLLGDPKTRMRMGQAGLETVRSRFSLDIMMARYKRYYRDLVEPVRTRSTW